MEAVEAAVRIASSEERAARSPRSWAEARRARREEGDDVTEAGTKDVIAGIFGVLALVASIVQFFYVPMAFGPLGLAFLVIAIMTSSKYRGLYELTAVLLTVGFIVGSAIAVVAENPLY
jgi:hypothetical protein